MIIGGSTPFQGKTVKTVNIITMIIEIIVIDSVIAVVIVVLLCKIEIALGGIHLKIYKIVASTTSQVIIRNTPKMGERGSHALSNQM